MSATEVIEQIEQLSLEEQKKVFAFVQAMHETQAGLLRDASMAAPAVRYLDRERARELREGIFQKNDELFRKLAQ